ncbi:ATP-binding/permease protein CydD [compost metagenome]
MGHDVLRLNGARLTFVCIAVLIIIQSLAILMQAKWLSEAVVGLFDGESLRQQLERIDLFLCAFLSRQAADAAVRRISFDFAERTGSSLRRELLTRLLHQGARRSAKEGTGHLVTLIREGIGQYRAYVEKAFPRMAAVGITPIFILVYVWMQDRMSAVILAVMLPLLIVFMILVGLTAGKHTRDQHNVYRKLSNHFLDSVRGLETLKLLGRSRSHGASVESISERYRQATMKTLRLAFLSSFALEFFTMLAVAMIAVGLGLRLVNGQMELLPALIVLMLAPEYFMPVRMMGADYHATMDGKEAGQSIRRLMDSLQEVSDSSELHRIRPDEKQGEHEEHRRYKEYREYEEQEEQEEHEAQKKQKKAPQSSESKLLALSIELQDVCVQHQDAAVPALVGITTRLSGPMTIGVIGESGAGKSTLIELLGGFMAPDNGSAIAELIYANRDRIEPVALSAQEWKRQVAYIPQHPYLFSMSLADNVRFYAPDAEDDTVKKAIEAVGLGPFVASLPGGMHTLLGSGGRQLSGGQEHRIALARAWLADRPVLLLDEPTAHLDIETEYELKQMMLQLFESKLVILATHRMHWMNDMARVLVVEQGQIVEDGSPAQLLERKGAYWQMLDAQWEGIL